MDDYKTHYTSGDTSGIKQTHPLCNKSIYTTSNYMTNDYNKVTCKNCLKMLNKKPIKDDMNDIINKPPHYNTGEIEVSDYIIDKELDYTDGNVIKYISRAKHKDNEFEDRKKALWYVVRGLLLCSDKDTSKALKAVEDTLQHFKDKEQK